MHPITTVLSVWAGWNISNVVKFFNGNYMEREEAAKSFISTSVFAAAIIAALAFWAAWDKKVASPASMTNSPTTQVESGGQYNRGSNSDEAYPSEILP